MKDSNTPCSRVRNMVHSVNREVSDKNPGGNEQAVSHYMIETKLRKGLKAHVLNGTTRLPKMKGMGWPLIEDKIIGRSHKEQAEAYRLYKEGKVYEAILHLFPNLTV